MREKPEDSQDFGQPADDQPKSNSPETGEENAFRVKDQFGSLDNIQPSSRPRPADPAKTLPAQNTDTASSPSRPKSIRRETDFQDFFTNLDFIKIMRGIYRRSWIVLLCAIVMFILSLPVAHLLKGSDTYSAESVIIYTKPTQKQVDTQGSSFLLRPLSQDTLVDMLLSPANIGQLEKTSGFEPLRRSVAFDSQSKSDIVTLIVNDMPDEATAIRMANTLADIVIKNNADYYKQLATAAYEQFRTQRIEAEKELADAVEAVENFQLKNQLLELNTQYQNFFSAKNAAAERLNIAKVAHEGLLVRIENYEKMIEELPDEVLDSAEEDNPLKREISNAEASLLQARIQFAADNPKILRQERHIQELRKMLQSGEFDSTRERTYVENPLKAQLKGELMKLRAEENVAVQQLSALKKDLDALNERFKELPALEKEYAALLERRAQADATYKTLKASETAAEMTKDTNLSDFRILSPADSAELSGASFLGKIIPLVGFVFGFFGGVALILLFELLDAKIRTQQQLENAYDAPCLASIVDIPELASHDAYNLLLPSLREISERLDVLFRGQAVKAIGLLSSLDDEGKSTLAFNLARYHKSLGTNVLYASFDECANPYLPHATDSAWPQMGIEDYLRGKAALPDMLSNIAGVDVIQVQNAGADLSDLAKGPRMQQLWASLKESYDLIITDIPAILDHPVAGTVGTLQDELIYVLASPVSDRKLVDAGLEYIEDRGLVPAALIFNRVSPFYLEDVRQQRVINKLTENTGGPLSDAKKFFSRLTSKAHKSTTHKQASSNNINEFTEEEEKHFNEWLNKSNTEGPTDDEK